MSSTQGTNFNSTMLWNVYRTDSLNKSERVAKIKTTVADGDAGPLSSLTFNVKKRFTPNPENQTFRVSCIKQTGTMFAFTHKNTAKFNTLQGIDGQLQIQREGGLYGEDFQVSYLSRPKLFRPSQQKPIQQLPPPMFSLILTHLNCLKAGLESVPQETSSQQFGARS